MKELKVRREIIALVSVPVGWNPVKELKVIFNALDCGRDVN